MLRKNVVKMIAACLLFMLFFQFLTAIFMPKWTSYHSDQMQTRIQAFYQQEKNSHDVIYLGSSYAYCGISPLTIWEEQGITGYVFAGTGQKAWMSAYYLEEALKYQAPKVVVFEIGALFDEHEASEENNRKSIDYMRWSSVKLKAVRMVCENTGESEKEYLFPLLRYHSRWRELDQKDFHLGWDSAYYLMGNLAWRAVRPAPEKKIDREEAESLSSPKVGPKCREAVLRMKKLCGEKGIQFQMVRVPSLDWSLEKAEAVRHFAEENDIPYLDMNLCREETGVDWREDTPDKGDHLNVSGCRKASSFLGEYLKENYVFETKLSDRNRKYWNESAAKFKKLSEDFARSGGPQAMTDHYPKIYVQGGRYVI